MEFEEENLGSKQGGDLGSKETEKQELQYPGPQMIWICREGYEEMAETWEGKKKKFSLKEKTKNWNNLTRYWT